MAINNHFMGKDIVKDLSKFFHSQYFFISIRIIQLKFISIRIIQLKANLFPNYVHHLLFYL